MRIDKSLAKKPVSVAHSGENLSLPEKLQVYFILHKNQHLSKEALVKYLYEEGLAQVLRKENLTVDQLLSSSSTSSE